MYIGKLNGKIKDIKFFCKKLDSDSLLEIAENSNPFIGQPFAVKWKDLTTNGLSMVAQFDSSYELDRVVLRLNEKSHPQEISLFGSDGKLCDKYAGETGMGISASVVSLAAEGSFDGIEIRIDSDFSTIAVDEIEIYGRIEDGVSLFPTPVSVRLSEGAVSCNDIYLGFDVSEEAKPAAFILAEKMSERGYHFSDNKPVPVSFVLNADIAANGYHLNVSFDRIEIAASDLRGFVIGVETLVKLADDGQIPVCNIEDAPFCEFRGAHLYIPGEHEMEFVKRMIREIFSPMGYNFIIMEVAGAMEFESHPEINEALLHALSQAKKGVWPAFPHGSVGDGTIVKKDSLRKLVDYARSYGIEIIPEIQSLGHVQFMTQAHPDIAEIAADAEEVTVEDERLADIPPSSFYAHSFCPSNPKSYEILFDLLDEIIEVFRPKEYVHMGHDEVYQIGICPKCKGKDPSDLLAEDLNRIHDYLSKKGLKMMIWADMLQPVTKYDTYRAIDKIPKDIMLLDFIWYFHMKDDIENNLLEKGFDVLFGNMYSSHFPRFEKRIRSNGVRGGQLSAWVGNNEEVLGREGKLYDFLYTGQMLWSESYRSENRNSYDLLLSRKIPYIRERLSALKRPSLANGTEVVIKPEGDCLVLDHENDASDLGVSGKYQSLIFEHTCNSFMRRIPWVKLTQVARYEVHYEDGEVVEIPLEYGGNVSHWDRKQNEPFHAGYYRHNGYSGTWFSDGKRVDTEFGKKGTVYAFEWVNPFPEKKICSVILKQGENTPSRVTVFSLRGIQ